MPKIFPIQCYRPARMFAKRFILKPSDFSYSDKEYALGKILKNSVFSISQPELFGYSFEESQSIFSSLLQKGFIFREPTPEYYLYTIILDDETYHGLVCSQKTSDLNNKSILLHEKTREKNSQFLEKRLESLRLNFNPIFSIVPDKEFCFRNYLLEIASNHTPEVNVEIDAGEIHQVTKIRNKEIIKKCEQFLEKTNTTYLADGHHRISVIKKLNEGNLDAQFPSILFPSEDVSIYSFAKIFSEVSTESIEHLIFELKQRFSIVRNENCPLKEGQFELFINKEWLRFETEHHPIQNLNFYQAINSILENQFGINNQIEDERVIFLKDIYGRESIENFSKKMQSQIAFRIHPLNVDDIFETAHTPTFLPAKSSLFEPKPRAGMFITRI